MEVIDVSSSDAEDYLSFSEEEYPHDGSELYQQDTRNANREDKIALPTESSDSSMHQFLNARSQREFEDAIKDMEERRDDPPAVKILSNSDGKTIKENDSRRILPSSFLSIGSSKERTQIWEKEKMKNNIILGAQGIMFHHSNPRYGSSVSMNEENQGKPSIGHMQKRFLPPLRPTTSTTVQDSRISHDEDIQILHFHKKSDNFGGKEDDIGPNGQGFYNHNHTNHRRHLPPWMSGGSAAEHPSASSSPGPLLAYPKPLGSQLGIGEKTIDQDERLIYQAALQVHIEEKSSSFVFFCFYT